MVMSGSSGMVGEIEDREWRIEDRDLQSSIIDPATLANLFGSFRLNLSSSFLPSMGKACPERSRRDKGGGDVQSFSHPYLNLPPSETVSQSDVRPSRASGRTGNCLIYNETIPFVVRLSNHERNCDTVSRGGRKFRGEPRGRPQGIVPYGSF